MAQKIGKAKYWTAVLYPECMVEDWISKIDDLLQIPYEYCIHDKDNDLEHDERKTHVHVVIAFPNTTTYKHALSVFQRLQDNIQYCEQVLNIRYIHNYLIHNTESAKKNNKYQYDPIDRISGNGFDIGCYEQLSITEKNNMCKELCDFIIDNCISNFTDFYISSCEKFGIEYFEVVRSYSGLLERLCKGNYLKMSKINIK